MRRSFLLVTLAVAACSREAPPPSAAAKGPMNVLRATVPAGESTVNLPKTAGPWTRPDAPTVVTAGTIFDYMDGAGELYVGYRFDRLDVFEYKAADASLGTILVELYSMKDPDDAFGLLSTDWGGEVPAFDKGGEHRPAGMPTHRSLYGAGLLRMWNRRLYIRVLAARETPQAREAVLIIGREISAEEEVREPPILLEALAGSPGDGSAIRPDRTCFFRSHLVLNSAYFLAAEDILGLGLDVEAVTTEFRSAAPGGRPTRLILVRYPAPGRARAALNTFAKAYLPEVVRKGAPAPSGATLVERGWVGWMLKARDLAIALDASTQASARQLTASTIKAAPEPGSAYR